MTTRLCPPQRLRIEVPLGILVTCEELEDRGVLPPSYDRRSYEFPPASRGSQEVPRSLFIHTKLAFTRVKLDTVTQILSVHRTNERLKVVALSLCQVSNCGTVCRT